MHVYKFLPVFQIYGINVLTCTNSKSKRKIHHWRNGFKVFIKLDLEDPYFLDISADHVFNIFNNRLRLSFCRRQETKIYQLQNVSNNKERKNLSFLRRVQVNKLPTATFVNPGRSMRVKLTTASKTCHFNN